MNDDRNRILQFFCETASLARSNVVPQVFVLAYGDMAEIEWIFHSVLRHYYRCERSERMPHPQFIRCIDVIRREIGNHKIGVKNLLIHRRINNTRVYDLVRPDAFKAGALDRFLDHLIRIVKVEFLSSCEVRFLSKTLNDKADLLSFRSTLKQTL